MSRTEALDFWPGRRVLVTGANGFVGGWLTKALIERGAAVVAFVRDQVLGGLDLHRCLTHSRVFGDLSDGPLVGRVLNEYEVDTVFHLAAQALVPVAARKPQATFESNVRGTWTLLEQCRLTRGVERIVVSTSDKVYGSQSGAVDENAPLLGRFPYDASKVCADVIAQSYALSFGLPLVVMRCANIYGGGDLNFSRIVPYAVRNALRGEPIILRSNGTLRRELIYVEDAVTAFLEVAEALNRADIGAQAFNFGSGESIDVNSLVTRIIEVVGRDPVEVVHAPEGSGGEIPEQSLNTAKAQRLLDWRPCTSLTSGLHQTVDWYRSHLRL